jgi:hypothetical protein
MRVKLAILTGIILVMAMIYGCYVKTNQAKTTDPGDASILEEPIFGLDYSYIRDNVHYELLAPSILHACAGLTNPTFIYAHATEGFSDYFVIMGPSPDVVGRGDALGGV